jgi:hypothetical protein
MSWDEIPTAPVLEAIASDTSGLGAIDTKLADARHLVVATLVEALNIDSDLLEDELMPAIDDYVRAEFGHEVWLGWVR